MTYQTLTPTINHRQVPPRFKPSVYSESPLLCRKDAAAYLGIATQTLAQWAVSRKYNLPYISIGRKAMYRITDLDAFIAANVQGGNAVALTEVANG